MAEWTDIAALGSFLEGLGALGEDGKFTELGKELLAHQLDHWLPERHGAAFEPIKRKANAPFAPVECVPVLDGKVLLKYRVHPIFGKGWHTAGTYPEGEKKEPMVDAVKRCARSELGIEVRVLRHLGWCDHYYNPRFPDVPHLFLCLPDGGHVKQLIDHDDQPQPGDCKWFSKCPPNMLPIQQDYCPIINLELGRKIAPEGQWLVLLDGAMRTELMYDSFEEAWEKVASCRLSDFLTGTLINDKGRELAKVKPKR